MSLGASTEKSAGNLARRAGQELQDDEARRRVLKRPREPVRRDVLDPELRVSAECELVDAVLEPPEPDVVHDVRVGDRVGDVEGVGGVLVDELEADVREPAAQLVEVLEDRLQLVERLPGLASHWGRTATTVTRSVPRSGGSLATGARSSVRENVARSARARHTLVSRLCRRSRCAPTEAG